MMLLSIPKIKQSIGLSTTAHGSIMMLLKAARWIMVFIALSA